MDSVPGFGSSDDVSQLSAHRFNLYRRFFDRDGFGTFAQFEHCIHLESGANVDIYIGAPIRFESRDSNIDMIVANSQAREGIYARTVGRGRVQDSGGCIGCADGGFRYDRATAVFNGSRNATPDGRVSQC
jgi:hypothetical protein